MAHRLLRDPDADGWERADFPIVCETCLGPNPYVRMQRMEFGGECHISGRPYTKFRWRPGNDARYKGTIICQEVAKAKNVCQVCLLDLDYNLPVQVRDRALGGAAEEDALPESDVGREFALERMANDGELGTQYLQGKPNDAILALQRTTPYYKRNRAPICSFFVKGECTRGAECPYRHEMPTTGELAQQNIKDRYFGVNDPVAKKMMQRAENLPELELPSDQTITTLYVGSVHPEISEDDIRTAFAPYGEITKIKKVDSRSCAFVTYAERTDAEEAASKLYNKLIVKGMRLRLMWGKPQERREAQLAAPSGARPPLPTPVPPTQPGAPPPVPISNLPNVTPAMPSNSVTYASMDPQQQGSSAPQPQKRKADGEGPPESKKQAIPPPLPGQRPPPGVFPRPLPGQFIPMGPPPPMYRPIGPPAAFPYGPMPGRGFPAGQMRPPMMQPGQGPPPGWRPPPAGIRPLQGRQ